MGKKVPFGGERLGSGDKLNFDLKTFNRSTHNLSSISRLDQAVGTLVPYKVIFGKKGDKFVIPIRTQMRTLPTNGPIFGSFKWQTDVFVTPLRLYNKLLHNNYTNIGMKMSKVYIPQIELQQDDGTYSKLISFDKKTDWQEKDGFQINDSSLLAMLGTRTQPTLDNKDNPDLHVGMYTREGASMLNYWEIYKNYYANKQEEEGVVLGLTGTTYQDVHAVRINERNIQVASAVGERAKWSSDISFTVENSKDYRMSIQTPDGSEPKLDEVGLRISGSSDLITRASDIVEAGTELKEEGFIAFNIKKGVTIVTNTNTIASAGSETNLTKNFQLIRFPLENIDEMRMAILEADKTVPFVINSSTYKMAEDISNNAWNRNEPYNSSVGLTRVVENGAAVIVPNYCYDQAGLGIRTYLSDRFNNWLNTEWIDGENGVAGITDIDVSNGKLSMDALNIMQKLYRMYNRVAASDGTYDSWLEATTGESVQKRCESPIFCGGKSDEIIFEEITSSTNVETAVGNSPLGTLAGRGALAGKQRGYVRIKLDEPSIIMVIGSIVPRVDYGQGNEWYTRLENIDQIHKPDLDGIAFQELLTDEFAGADTTLKLKAGTHIGDLEYHSVGKQVSWQQYMTDTNHTYGGFAPGRELDYMALNRVYHYDKSNRITDATTYIDPTIFNHVFADETLNAKNFWVQVAMDTKARRLMSAKQIPNL